MKMRSAALALLLATGIAQAEEAAEGVNINEADSQTMAAELDGVGPVKAEAIIDFREKRG